MNKILSLFVGFWNQVRRGDFSALSGLGRYSDLALPIGVMLLIGTFFIPLPTYVLSALLAINLALSFVVLATSLYLRTPIELTSYPTILLITTLFRLCLSVSVRKTFPSAIRNQFLNHSPNGGA
jgi:type III secretion protein V